MPDRFAATWVALESILNSISYPGVFKGERAKLREEITGKVRQIGLPKTTRESLSITTDMLENRILQDNWSLARKLRIFAESLGIQLNPNDRQLVGKLSEARNTIFHEGDGSPELSQEQVDQLQYLVERLIVAVSIGGYEDLEDGIHQFHLGTIGPEGGAAPISINGKEDIPYQLIGTMNDQGELVTEWIVEGKIYPHKNIVFVRPDHNQET